MILRSASVSSGSLPSNVNLIGSKRLKGTPARPIRSSRTCSANVSIRDLNCFRVLLLAGCCSETWAVRLTVLNSFSPCVNPSGTSTQRSTFPASSSCFAFSVDSISAKTSLGHVGKGFSSDSRRIMPRRVAKRGDSGPVRTSESDVADCCSSVVFNPVRTPRELDKATNGYVIIGKRSVTATVLRSRKNSSKSRRASDKAAQRE